MILIGTYFYLECEMHGREILYATARIKYFEKDKLSVFFSQSNDRIMFLKQLMKTRAPLRLIRAVRFYKIIHFLSLLVY